MFAGAWISKTDFRSVSANYDTVVYTVATLVHEDSKR